MSKYVMALLLLTGCATPQTILSYDGHYVSCGGSSVGSVAGGYIGYSLQRDSDDKCVHDYVAQGYVVAR